MLSVPVSWHLTVLPSDDTVVVHFSGSAISLHEMDGDSLRDQLFRLAETVGDRRLVLDLANVEFLTSTTIEILLALRRRLRTHGGTLSLCNLTPVVAEVVSALSLAEILDAHVRIPRRFS
jgi:anti-anti-sigma factor